MIWRIFFNTKSMQFGKFGRLTNRKQLTIWRAFDALRVNMQSQQDWISLRKARVVKNWMANKGVAKIDWPAKLPNLNQIENLQDDTSTKNLC